MNKSESIANLAKALSILQGQLHSVPHNKQNPYFKNSYADLSAIWTAVRKPLADNNLAISQVLSTNDEGRPCLDTVIMHASGEWISSSVVMWTKDQTPQSLGSATTYYKRYSLAAILGVSDGDIDDDAEAAESRPEPSLYRQTPAQEPQAHTKPLTISEPQARRLHAIKKSANWSDVELKAFLSTSYKLTTTKDIPWVSYDEICKYIEAHPKQPQNELGF